MFFEPFAAEYQLKTDYRKRDGNASCRTGFVIKPQAAVIKHGDADYRLAYVVGQTHASVRDKHALKSETVAASKPANEE